MFGNKKQPVPSPQQAVDKAIKTGKPPETKGMSPNMADKTGALYAKVSGQKS